MESSIQISLNNVCKYAVSNNQHEFIANKSTTTHLLELSAYITDIYIKKPNWVLKEVIMKLNNNKQKKIIINNK